MTVTQNTVKAMNGWDTRGHRYWDEWLFWWLLGGDQGAWGQGSKQEALHVGT